MSENNNPDAIPAKLKSMTRVEVMARAQRILDHRGKPPYAPIDLRALEWSDDEAAVVSEFVEYWMPFLTIKEK